MTMNSSRVWSQFDGHGLGGCYYVNRDTSIIRQSNMSRPLLAGPQVLLHANLAAVHCGRAPT